MRSRTWLISSWVALGRSTIIMVFCLVNGCYQWEGLFANRRTSSRDIPTPGELPFAGGFFRQPAHFLHGNFHELGNFLKREPFGQAFIDHFLLVDRFAFLAGFLPNAGFAKVVQLEHRADLLTIELDESANQ